MKVMREHQRTADVSALVAETDELLGIQTEGLLGEGLAASRTFPMAQRGILAFEGM